MKAVCVHTFSRFTLIALLVETTGERVLRIVTPRFNGKDDDYIDVVMPVVLHHRTSEEVLKAVLEAIVDGTAEISHSPLFITTVKFMAKRWLEQVKDEHVETIDIKLLFVA